MTIEVFAPAKVNLTLHVTGQREDGYHLLDSLVAFADVGDRLWLTAGGALSIDVSGPFAEGVPEDQSNLVWQAAELAGWQGRIQLEKNLPHGGGIGGGSSDAAALLRAVAPSMNGASLGADVPVCQLGAAARMSGIGEAVAEVADMPSFFAVLANPMVHVPTPIVFAALTEKTNPAMPAALPKTDWLAWLMDQRNDLEAAACAQAPLIGDTLKALSKLPGQCLCRMSGSGATCFALFKNREPAELAARNLRAAHPTWWVVDCVLS